MYSEELVNSYYSESNTRRMLTLLSVTDVWFHLSEPIYKEEINKTKCVFLNHFQKFWDGHEGLILQE